VLRARVGGPQVESGDYLGLLRPPGPFDNIRLDL